jgi:hypothetical protein
MIALPYAECIEIVIKALTCQVSAAFDADLFGDTYAAPEDNHDQIDRAEALALWGKGLLVWQIGLKVSDMGGDSCSVLFDLLHSDRIAVVPKINSPVRSVKRHGLDFEIFTDSGVIPGDQVLLLLLPPAPCDAPVPEESLQAEPAPSPEEPLQTEPASAPPSPSSRRRTPAKKDAVKVALQELEAERYRPPSLDALHEEVCSRLRWKRDAFSPSTMKRALEELGWNWRTLGA